MYKAQEPKKKRRKERVKEFFWHDIYIPISIAIIVFGMIYLLFIR